MEFARLNLKVDVEPLKAALETTDLWNQIPFRKRAEHKEMVDIWVRFNDIQPFLRKGDLTGLCDEHDSIWYRSPLVPLVKPIAHQIMAHVQGERLGGILITKLPPNGKIDWHSDGYWHAEYYEKYYVCVKDSGSRFRFVDGDIEPEEGDVWWFKNSKPHAVENQAGERIAMIVCIKIDQEGEALCQ